MTMHLGIELTPADLGTRLTQTSILNVVVSLPVNAILESATGRKKAWTKVVAKAKRITEPSG